MASETPSEAKPSQADITVLGQEEVQNATPAPDPAPADVVDPAPAPADVVDPAEAPAPVPAPAPELTSPSIAERVSVPATPPSGDTSEEGGEWDLLSTKVRQWWGEQPGGSPKFKAPGL